MQEPIIVTYSSLAKFKNCQRAYRYRVVDQIVPVRFVAEPLTFGRLVHGGLETWFSGMDFKKTLTTLRDQLQKSDFGLDTPQSRQVLTMLGGYMANYPDDRLWTVEGIEVEFGVPIEDQWLFKGKIDGVVRANALRYILEHKTAQRVDYGYLSGLQGDFQSLTYSYFYPIFSGHKVDGVCYDILQKPSIRLKKSETLEEYAGRLEDLYADSSMFHREYLHFGIDDFADYREELFATLELLKQSYDRHCDGDPHAFIKNSQFCFNWGRPCAYFPLCRSLDNPTIRENSYKHEPPHSELSGSKEIPF